MNLSLPRWSSAVALFSLAAACAPSAAEPSSCDAANQRVRDCFGSDYTDCTEAGAKQVLAATSCDAIANAADPNGKSDGGYCPRFLWWICGSDVTQTCAAAGDGAGYRYFTNEQKLDYHWQWGLCTEYGEPGNADLAKGWKVLSDAAKGIGSSILRLDRVFTNSTDELDSGRRKLLHPYGSLVQVTFARAIEPDAACSVAYTGMWSEDSLDGLARLGWGQDPKAIGYVPGIALKFFVAGSDSVNLHLIHSLQGDPNEPNFFAQTLTNVLPIPTSGTIKALVKYFQLFADQPLHLGLEHLGLVYSDGSTVDAADAVAPYQIVLEPANEARQLYEAQLDSDAKIDFRNAFRAIPAGTRLYEVYAWGSPYTCKQHLGTITTKTEFRASQWGDERLFFQHATEGQGY